MFRSQLSRPTLRHQLSLLLSGAMLCAGCASWDLRGPPFRDEPNLGRKSDKYEGKSTGLFGFSTKSQQIERNLGVE